MQSHSLSVLINICMADTVVCLNVQFILSFFLEEKSEFHSRISNISPIHSREYLPEINIVHQFYRDSWIYSAIYITSIYCTLNCVLGTEIEQITPASWSLHSDGSEDNKQNKQVSYLS